MLSIRARKVLFWLIGIAIVSIIVEVVLLVLAAFGSLGVALVTSAWFIVADALIVNVLGVIIGLIWEKSTRARYLAKLENNPAPSERTRKAYRIVLMVSVVIGAFSVLSNLWAVYEFYALNFGTLMTVPPATHTGFYIGLVRNIILALVFLWLYSEPEQKEGSPILDTKKGSLLVAIYFLIAAIFSILSLSMFKVGAGTTSIQVRGQETEKPLQTVIVGQGRRVSLGEMFPSLGGFSLVLPPDFKMVALEGDFIAIAPATSSSDVSTSTGTYILSVLAVANPPKDYINGFASDFQQGGDKNIVVTSTTFSEYPAWKVSYLSADYYTTKTSSTWISFQPNDIPFAIQFDEAANPTSTSLRALNSELESVFSTLTFGTSTPTGNDAVPSRASAPAQIPPVTGNVSIPSATSAKPSITILSPSGGETWQMGQTQTVKWTSIGVKNIVLFIHFSDGGMCREGMLPASAGAYSFILTPACPNMPATLTSGQYTINITDSDPGSNNPDAESASFNIATQL